MRELHIWEDVFDRVLIRLELAARGRILTQTEAAAYAEYLKKAWWRPGAVSPPRNLMHPPPPLPGDTSAS